MKTIDFSVLPFEIKCHVFDLKIYGKRKYYISNDNRFIIKFKCKSNTLKFILFKIDGENIITLMNHTINGIDEDILWDKLKILKNINKNNFKQIIVNL